MLRGSRQLSALHAIATTAASSARPSEMFASGKKLAASAKGSASGANQTPSAPATTVSPSGQPAG
jgi:hypothetical protein